MRKYQELVEEYTGWIEEIQQLEKSSRQLGGNAERELEGVSRDDARVGSLVGDIEEADQMFADAQFIRSFLMNWVKDAYASVLFEKTRQQGIAGFYREAGI